MGSPQIQRAWDVEPVARKPLGDEVYRVLRRMIVHGQMAPGEKVVESRVAAALGVSRTPVREALLLLERDGLVNTRPGHTPRVTAPTLADVHEIYSLIAVLEGLAARLATPRLTADDLRHMNELTQAMEHHARAGETEKLLGVDTQFHAVLHRRSQNRRLQQTVAELRGQMERFEYAFFATPREVRASLKRHRKLVRVLERRDPLAAECTLRRQWKLGERALVEIIREGKAVAATPGGTNSQHRTGRSGKAP